MPASLIDATTHRFATEPDATRSALAVQAELVNGAREVGVAGGFGTRYGIGLAVLWNGTAARDGTPEGGSKYPQRQERQK